MKHPSAWARAVSDEALFYDHGGCGLHMDILEVVIRKVRQEALDAAATHLEERAAACQDVEGIPVRHELQASATQIRDLK